MAEGARVSARGGIRASGGVLIESVARGRTRRGTHSVDEADGVAAVLRDEVAAAAEASEHARVAPSRARCASLCGLRHKKPRLFVDARRRDATYPMPRHVCR